MGLETAFLIATIASAGTQIFSGFAANRAAGAEADLQGEQASIAREESIANAERVAADRKDFLKRQKLAFIKSGVSLAGSPLLVLETTRSESQKEVDAIAKRGRAQETVLLKQASQTRSGGRAALIGGFGRAAGTVTTGAVQGKTAGIF